MSGGGSKVPDTVTQITKNEPWSGAQPFLSGLYSSAQNLPLQNYFPYQTYAQRSPLTNASQQAQVGYATNYLPGLVSAGTQGISSMLNAPSVANNPYVNNMISAQGQQITDQLQRQWLPAIRSGASQAGSYGGSRQGIAEGVAIGDAAKAFAQSAAQTQLGAYGQGLDAQARGMAFLPQQAQLGMLPANIYGQVGAAQEGYNKDAIINDAYNRYMFAQQAPYTRLSTQVPAIAGVPMSSTRTSDNPDAWNTGGSTLGNVLGGGMTGYSLGNALGSSAFGTAISTGLGLPAYMGLGIPGMAIGAGLGLLGNLF